MHRVIKLALAPLLSLLILKETIQPATIAGIFLIAAGSMVSFLARRQNEMRKQPIQGGKA